MNNCCNNKIIAVTGATGFIGGHFILSARRRGCSVLALIRHSSDNRFLEKEGIPYRRVDFSNTVAVSHALDGVAKVVHIAGPGLVDLVTGNEDPTPNIASLIKSSQEVGVKRFVYLSTVKAGKPKQFHDKTHNNRKFENDIYGNRKRFEERALAELGNKLNWIVVRAPAVYGPFDRKMLTVFQLSQRRYVPILPHSKCSRFSIIHVADLVRALLLAVESDLPRSEILEVGNKEPMTWNNLIGILLSPKSSTVTVPFFLLQVISFVSSLIASMKGVKYSLVLDRLRDISEYDWVIDPDVAEKKLGFRPSIPIYEGLRECLEQYKEAGLI